MSTGLPTPFQDLEPYIDWAKPTMNERLSKRLASTFEDVTVYYNAMLPRIEDVLTYLNQYPLNQMPADAARLMNLALSFAETITCVEYYRSTRIPKGCEHERFPLVNPSHVK